MERHSRDLRAAGFLLGALLLLGGACPARAQSGTGMQQDPAGPGPVHVFSRQDATLALGLNEAVDAALSGSFEIYRLQQRYLQLSYGLEEARRGLKTHVSFDSLLPSVSQGFTNLLYNDFAGTLALDLFQDDIMHVMSRVEVTRPLITNGYVSFRGGVTGYERSMILANAAPGSPKAELRYVLPRFSLDFNQPLFQYNRVRGKLRTAQLDLESLELSYGEVEVQRINEVTRAFYSLYRAQQLLQLADEGYRQSLQNSEIGQRRYDLGMVSQMDKLGLDVTMVNARDRLLQAQTEHERSQLELGRVLGASSSERIWVDADDSWSPVSVDLDRALERALQNRSDVRQREIALEQTGLELKEVVSRGRPDLQFNLSVDYTGNSTLPGYGVNDSWGKHFGAGFDPANMGPNTNVNLQLRIPLLDGRENESAVLRKQSEIRVLEREREQTRSDLEREVRTRVQELSSAQQRLRMQDGNRGIARTAYEVTRQRFETGEAGLSELLLAQQRYQETESYYVDAFIAYRMARVALQEVTMWDWGRDAPLRRRTEPPKPFSGDAGSR